MSNEALRARHYPPEMWDNDGVFLEMIKEKTGSQSCVLDAGAGAGDAFPYELKDNVNEMVGIDLDPRVLDNPRLHKGVHGNLDMMPFQDETFDIVFCRYVLEHLGQPNAFAAEIARVLKPGGRFIFLTPSKWHYVAMGARLTPDWFHDFL